MSTKDLTHEAVMKALAEGTPLTHEQRASMLGLVVDNQAWQREADRLRADNQRLSAELERAQSVLQAVKGLSALSFDALKKEGDDLRADLERAQCVVEAAKALSLVSQPRLKAGRDASDKLKAALQQWEHRQ